MNKFYDFLIRIFGEPKKDPFIEFKKTIFESNDIQSLIKCLIKDEHKNTLY